jgi:predicted  nucleic acid-binding Zn-ribbon protein
MVSQSDTERAIPFAGPAKNENSDGGDRLDSAGQAILKLLSKASDLAEANSRQALETAQTLSKHLDAAEDRIAALEEEIHLWREKSERAEQWMVKIFKDIEERLLREPEERQRRLPRL